MRNLKLMAVMMILCFITTAGIVKAQDSSKSDKVFKYKNTPEEQAKKMTDRMKSKLKLTDEQYGKILKLNNDNITYMRELRAKDIISKSEVKSKMKDYRDGIKSTLTDKQFKKFKKMMRKMHHKRRHTGW